MDAEFYEQAHMMLMKEPSSKLLPHRVQEQEDGQVVGYGDDSDQESFAKEQRIEETNANV